MPIFHLLCGIFLLKSGFATCGDDNFSTCSDVKKFKSVLSSSKNVFILTGAGISAESGIPTYRGPDKYWRTYHPLELDNVSSFRESPSLVWEFNHYRRELINSKQPNAAHYAIAKFQSEFAKRGYNTSLITQNIDELHRKAGSRNIIELHGSVYRTKCTKCGTVRDNYDSPICEGLRGKGAADAKTNGSDIPINKLPHCNCSSCNGLLRPAIVWFGEFLNDNIMSEIDVILRTCDLGLIIGTSSVVKPASYFGTFLADKGVPVAEFNLEHTECTQYFRFHFQGPCTKTVPEALSDYIT